MKKKNLNCSPNNRIGNKLKRGRKNIKTKILVPKDLNEMSLCQG